MRFRPWLAVVLISSLLLCGCAGNQAKPEQTAMAATTEEPETIATIATEPTTLPPATPPEEVLPQIETLVADTPNARAYIEDGTLCVDTSDEITTGTGSIAYDRFEGSADAWQKVIDNSVALCLLMRTTMDDAGAYDTPAKVTVLDHRFDSRAILTIVDGSVIEDTVAIALASNPPMLPNAPTGSDGETIIHSGGGGNTVWIPTNGGEKYHKTRTCSGMINPDHVSIEEAQAQGFEPCKKCYG